jgi:hypothetical protein
LCPTVPIVVHNICQAYFIKVVLNNVLYRLIFLISNTKTV